ncbi:MAG: hypothetical protein RRX92_06345 [Lachnospiraceae bacterium]
MGDKNPKKEKKKKKASELASIPTSKSEPMSEPALVKKAKHKYD